MTSDPTQLSPDDQPTIHGGSNDPISATKSPLLPLAAAHSAQPLTTFTPFPRLPIELRLKIFKLAIPTGPKGFHMLEVTAEVTEGPEKVENEGRTQYQWVFSLQNNDHVSEIK
jgi:hypothetical protein